MSALDLLSLKIEETRALSVQVMFVHPLFVQWGLHSHRLKEFCLVVWKRGSPPHIICPFGLEELKKLSSNNLGIICHCQGTILQKSDAILMSFDNGGLVEELCVTIAILDPYNPWFLPPKNVIVSSSWCFSKQGRKDTISSFERLP